MLHRPASLHDEAVFGRGRRFPVGASTCRTRELPLGKLAAARAGHGRRPLDAQEARRTAPIAIPDPVLGRQTPDAHSSPPIASATRQPGRLFPRLRDPLRRIGGNVVNECAHVRKAIVEDEAAPARHECIVGPIRGEWRGVRLQASIKGIVDETATRCRDITGTAATVREVVGDLPPGKAESRAEGLPEVDGGGVGPDLELSLMRHRPQKHDRRKRRRAQNPYQPGGVGNRQRETGQGGDEPGSGEQQDANRSHKAPARMYGGEGAHVSWRLLQSGPSVLQV